MVRIEKWNYNRRFALTNGQLMSYLVCLASFFGDGGVGSKAAWYMFLPLMLLGGNTSSMEYTFASGFLEALVPLTLGFPPPLVPFIFPLPTVSHFSDMMVCCCWGWGWLVVAELLEDVLECWG